MFLESKRVGEKGRKFRRCSSFNGERGTAVEGRTFTPKPMAKWSKDPDSSHARYQAKHCKPPEARQMLCTDIRIEEGEPEKVFIEAWNRLVDGKGKFIESGGDLLELFRAKELHRLIKEIGIIDTAPYDIILKTLNHIEIECDGKIKVVFLARAIVQQHDNQYSVK
jgi:hypothetical protein